MLGIVLKTACRKGRRGISVEYIVHGAKSGLFRKVPNHLYFDTERFAGFIVDE